jgi:hypothetical protein
MGLIQTADQLRFSYLAVIEGAKFIMGDSSVQVSSALAHGQRFPGFLLFCFVLIGDGAQGHGVLGKHCTTELHPSPCFYL